MARKLAAIVMLAVLVGTVAFLYYYTKNPIEGADAPRISVFGLESHTLDKALEAEVSGVTEIVVSSVSADVILKYEDRINLSAHFSGEAKTRKGSTAPDLSVRREGTTIIVEVEPRTISMYRIEQSALKLEVALPVDFSGAVSLKSVSGEVLVLDGAVASDLSAETVSGRITVGESFVSGTFRANSVSGEIGTAHISADKYLANTISGSVDAVRVTDAESVKIGTVSGSINLGLPDGENFAISASTVSGTISCDFPVRVESTGSKKLVGTVGDGSMDLQLTTVSGSINVDAL